MKRRMILFVVLAVIAILSLQLLVTNQVSSDQGYNVETPFDSITGPPHWLFNGSYANYLCKCVFSTINNNKLVGQYNNTECITYKLYNVSLNMRSYSTMREDTNPKNGSLLCNIQYLNATDANLTNVSLPVMLSTADLNYFSENQLPPDNYINKPVSSNSTLTTGLMVLKADSPTGNKTTVKVYEISKNKTIIGRFLKTSIFINCTYSAYSGLLLNSNYLYNSTVSYGNCSYLRSGSLNLTSTNISVVPPAVLNIFTVDYGAIIITPILVAVAAIAILYYRKKI